jgi:hypothetical protein
MKNLREWCVTDNGTQKEDVYDRIPWPLVITIVSGYYCEQTKRDTIRLV